MFTANVFDNPTQFNHTMTAEDEIYNGRYYDYLDNPTSPGLTQVTATNPPIMPMTKPVKSTKSKELPVLDIFENKGRKFR